MYWRINSIACILAYDAVKLDVANSYGRSLVCSTRAVTYHQHQMSSVVDVVGPIVLIIACLMQDKYMQDTYMQDTQYYATHLVCPEH